MSHPQGLDLWKKPHSGSDAIQRSDVPLLQVQSDRCKRLLPESTTDPQLRGLLSTFAGSAAADLAPADQRDAIDLLDFFESDVALSRPGYVEISLRAEN